MAAPVQSVADAKKEAKGLLKILQVIQKFVAKEFIWILAAIFFGIPFALVLMFVLDVLLAGMEAELEAIEGIDVVDIFLACYILSLAGIYVIRFILSALKVMASKSDS